MKITAKLALDQVRRNKKRTFGAVTAIAISTALITAVSCFLSSGNQMLRNFLGEDYGDYGSLYTTMLLIPAIILGFLIFAMSVTVISNVFENSAGQRIRELGVIKCVGGTKKQIRETIVYESIWLCLIGIPLGILLGIALGYFGVSVTGQFVCNLNELQQSIIMRPISFSLSFYLTPYALFFAAVFSLFTVLWSANKPAKKVAQIAAISCVKGMPEEKIKAVKVKKNKIRESFFGFDGLLAERNISRSGQGYKPTIRALSLGILLILSCYSLAVQARGIEAFMSWGNEQIMVDYITNHVDSINEDTGLKIDEYDKPIDITLAEEVTEKLREYDENLEITGYGVDNGTYYISLDPKYLTEEMKEAIAPDENGNYLMRVELICLDSLHYKKLCEIAKVPVGSNLLLNYYKYNDNGIQKEVAPFTDIKSAELMDAYGKTKEIEIHGVLTKETILPEMMGLNDEPFRVLVPDASMRYFDWLCIPEDEADYMEYARNITDSFFPTYTDDPYAKEGFSVRISRTDTMVKVLNIAIVIAEVILYGFVAMLLLIGIVSVISTLSTNIMARAKEFAVLKTVGMTSKGLKRMLLYESIFCTMKASVRGIIFGILIPWVINLALRKVFPIRYSIPFGMILMSVILIFGLVVAVTFYAIRKLRKQNLIETIRMETV